MDERERLVEQLFDSHQAEAVRIAWGLTGDAGLAQELAQEAFVRLYVHRHRLRDEAAAPAYLRRTVVNLALSHGRRTGRRRAVDRSLAGEPHELVADRAVAVADDRLDLRDALDRLPPRRRACVVLRYYLDLTEADTARALGISVGTVKSQTHKALLQLRGLLADDDGTPVIRPAGDGIPDGR